MDYFKKKKIREKWNKYKGGIIGTGAFLLVGGIAILIGMYANGWNFIKWIKTGYGLTTLICVILGAFGLTMFWLWLVNLRTTDRL